MFTQQRGGGLWAWLKSMSNVHTCMYMYSCIHICMYMYMYMYMHSTTMVLSSSSPQFLKERFKIDMPHRFKPHTFLGPTFCEMCGQLMHGIFKQQYKCEGTCTCTCTLYACLVVDIELHVHVHNVIILYCDHFH